MKPIKIFFCCFCFLIANQSLNAQFWKKIKKKLENKIEQKVEQKIDKEADKLIDSTLYGKRKKKEIPTSEIPKFTSETGILKLYNHGYEYVTKDITISVYGNYNKENLSESVKTYGEDRIIAPVDAFPKGYVLAFNDDGYLNPKEGEVVIHHSDSTKIVYSLRGTWNTFEGNKPVNGSFVSLSVVDIVDKRKTISNNQTENVSSSESNNSSINNTQYNTEEVSPTINIPSTFSFNKTISIEITDDRDGKYPMEFLLGNYPDIYGISMASKEMQGQGEVIVVMTPKTSTAFMSVAGMKMRKSTTLDQMGSQFNMKDRLPEDSEMEYKKTGNTKSILGYVCEEYKVDYNYSDTKGSASFWVSKDFPIQNKKLPMLGMDLNHKNFEGFVLELNSTHQGETWTMKVVNIKNAKLNINTNEYRKMSY